MAVRGGLLAGRTRASLSHGACLISGRFVADLLHLGVVWDGRLREAAQAVRTSVGGSAQISGTASRYRAASWRGMNALGFSTQCQSRWPSNIYGCARSVTLGAGCCQPIPKHPSRRSRAWAGPAMAMTALP